MGYIALQNDRRNEMQMENEIDAFTVFFILICILGIIGNLIVIIIILLLKEYKKTFTHWSILQLAIADTLFVTTIPFVVSQRMNDWWYFGDGVCKFKEAMVFINYYASMMFLMVMSIDRYIAVCLVFTNRVQNFVNPIAVTVVVWILAVLLSTPIIIYSYQGRTKGSCACKTKFPPTQLDKCLENIKGANAQETCTTLIKNCGPHSPVLPRYHNKTKNSTQSTPSLSEPKDLSIPRECKIVDKSPVWRGYVWFNFTVMLILPLTIMVFCYGSIVYQSWNVKISSSSAEKDKKRITITCAVLVATFALCWILFHSVHIAKLYGIHLSVQSCRILTDVSTTLPFINSTLNPFLYSFLGPGCLQKCKKVLASTAVRRITIMTKL